MYRVDWFLKKSFEGRTTQIELSSQNMNLSVTIQLNSSTENSTGFVGEPRPRSNDGYLTVLGNFTIIINRKTLGPKNTLIKSM